MFWNPVTKTWQSGWAGIAFDNTDWELQETTFNLSSPAEIKISLLRGNSANSQSIYFDNASLQKIDNHTIYKYVPEKNDEIGMYFDGEDDYIEVANAAELNPTDAITIVSKVRLYSLPPLRYYPVDKLNQYRYFIDSVGRIYWQLSLDGNWASNWIHTSKGIKPNQTYQIVTSYSSANQNAKIYINGVLYASGSPPNGVNIDAKNDSLYMGYKDDQQYLHGKIYYVYIYNRQLSDSEIQQIYEGNIPTDGLVFYHDYTKRITLPDGRIPDLSGNGNHGTINGARFTGAELDNIWH